MGYTPAGEAAIKAGWAMVRDLSGTSTAARFRPSPMRLGYRCEPGLSLDEAAQAAEALAAEIRYQGEVGMVACEAAWAAACKADRAVEGLYDPYVENSRELQAHVSGRLAEALSAVEASLADAMAAVARVEALSGEHPQLGDVERFLRSAAAATVALGGVLA
jgi:hypothetical protein